MSKSLGAMKLVRYLEAEGVWLFAPSSGESFEVIVAGDQSAPAPARLALMEKAVFNVAQLRERAVAFLEEFVDKDRIGKGSEWHLEGIGAGRIVGEVENQFSIYFSIECDTYGEWSVSFVESGLHFYPVAFSRRQV